MANQWYPMRKLGRCIHNQKYGLYPELLLTFQVPFVVELQFPPLFIFPKEEDELSLFTAEGGTTR